MRFNAPRSTMSARATGTNSPLRSYCAIAGLYLLLLTVLKVVEFFLWDIHASNSLQILLNAVVYNLVVASWTVLAVGLLYYIVQLLSRRTAVILAAVFYALCLLSETGLLVYALHNGYLLGCELVARPLFESWMAIRGAVGVFLPVVLTLLLVGGFIALALWRARRPSKAAWAVPAVVLLFSILSLCFKTSHLVVSQYSHYILNKTHYLCVDSYHYLSLTHQPATIADGSSVDYDETLVANLLATHPEWGNNLDPTYPLERQLSPDTFLNAWFNNNNTSNVSGQQPPNIVIIIVESLGNEFMGNGTMPFVDSLAATGLYFPNCLSTATRSYGAIPAVTGSVGGPGSFQFGTMPAHNSLLSLLRQAGYNTRSFYCGDYTFDCIYEYLSAQRIDYLSSYFDDYKALPDRLKGNWWGYNDDTLFSRALRDMGAPSSTPALSLITTLTMHDGLSLSDPARQAAYEHRASLLPVLKEHPALNAPAALFTDDCLRLFFRQYSRRNDFNNTLFVITGDHSSGALRGDRLSYLHVPLILWSPLVKRPARFTHTVTHNDIAPALYALLTTHYHLPAQPTVHWLGDGLAPTPKTLLVANYTHDFTDLVYHHYYYQAASPAGPESLHTFGPDMVLTPCSDPAALDSCRRQLALMSYLYNYTYYRNRLTAHPLYSREYTTKRCLHLALPVECVIPDEPPSKTGCIDTWLLPATRLKSTDGYATVRLTVNADVTVHDSLLVLQFPEMHIKFVGDETVKEYDSLAKFLSANAEQSPGTYRLALSKEFSIGSADADSLSVSISSPWSDDNWKPGARITLSNTIITVEYGK